MPESQGTPCSKQALYLKFSYELSSCGFAVTSTSDIAPVLIKEFLDTHATIECGFTLKYVRDMIRTCSTALVVRGIHRNVDICQTDYDIPSKLEFSPYFEMIHGCATFKLMKYWQRWKENDQLFNFFNFLHSNVPDNKRHKRKWRVLFFIRIKLVARVLACARAIARIKWTRLI